MTDKERWLIQNKLYRMKERKEKLKTFLKLTEDEIKFLKNFKLFEVEEGIKFRHMFMSTVIFFLLHLDKVFGFYYMKYKAFKTIKKAKKEIITLTQEIQYYEYKLWRRQT